MSCHVNESHICDVCNLVFTRKVSLEVHKKSHERASQSLVAPVICKYCNIKCLNNKTLIRHIIQNHETQQNQYHSSSLQHSDKGTKKASTVPKCLQLGVKQEYTPKFSNNKSASHKKEDRSSKVLMKGFYHPAIRKYPYKHTRSNKNHQAHTGKIKMKSSEMASLKSIVKKMKNPRDVVARRLSVQSIAQRGDGNP